MKDGMERFFHWDERSKLQVIALLHRVIEGYFADSKENVGGTVKKNRVRRTASAMLCGCEMMFTAQLEVYLTGAGYRW
jgi:hypothetical protein